MSRFADRNTLGVRNRERGPILGSSDLGLPSAWAGSFGIALGLCASSLPPPYAGHHARNRGRSAFCFQCRLPIFFSRVLEEWVPRPTDGIRECSSLECPRKTHRPRGAEKHGENPSSIPEIAFHTYVLGMN